MTKKKILLLSDDLRMTSGIANVSKQLVLGTVDKYDWVQLGAAIQHPDAGKVFDLNESVREQTGVKDANVKLYPSDGYGNPDAIRQLLMIEKPDAIMFFTDPRYWIWLFQMESEIRKKIPMIYLNIWDDLPAPLYNKAYYESCDTLMAISKQTLNINRMVLGDRIENKILKYVPHGINHKVYFPINEFMKDDTANVEKKREQLFGKDQPEFVVFYNARNIRRKSTSDLIAAYAEFCESIGKEKAKKCALLLHTQVRDDNGTDLSVVRDLLCDPEYVKVVFHDARIPSNEVNWLYNIADVTALISSNEGWGLSLTESLMAGKMIIANVTGGMQDQLRFEDEDGNWIDFDENFCSNHFGTYKKHGEWAVPVFPTNSSIVGSIPTPYIFDDRCDFRDVAKAIKEVYDLDPQERAKRGNAGRDWVLSQEAKMSAETMCQNVVECIDQTFETFEPRKSFELTNNLYFSILIIKNPHFWGLSLI